MILKMIKARRILQWYGLFGWKNQSGFNLIELFTVTLIISILAAMSSVSVIRAKVQARETAALATLTMITTAYEEYRFRYKEYPQWGPDQRFESPTELVDFLIAEGFMPSVYKNYDYYESYNMFRGFTESYYLQILPYDPNALEPPTRGSYYIILVPYNYQRSYLGAFFDPLKGAVTVKARKGDAEGSMDSYRIFTFKD